MNSWDLREICKILLECGKTALKYYENPPVTLKDDDTVVTAADREIEALLVSAFDHPEHGCYLIGEETIESRSEEYIKKALESENCYIVDPIDGTMPYSVHIPMWGISIALARKGKICEGAIYLPGSGEMIITSGEKCFFADKVELDIGPGQVDLRKMIFAQGELTAAGVVSVSQNMAKSARFTFSNQIVSISSCVGSMMWLFTGRFIAYAAMLKLWDIAACMAIMKHSSFKTRTESGKKLSLYVEESFELDAKSAKRWYINELTLIAPDMRTIDFLRRNTLFIKEEDHQ